MATTLRRPVVPGIQLDARIPDALLIELPFPNTLAVIDQLLFAYLDEQRVHSHAFFVLDVSGAYRHAALAQEENPDKYYSIVLMSDGENTDGISLENFRNYYNSLPPEAQNIRTFTVLFGNADRDTMEHIAESTGGRVFDGTKDSLSFIFKQIRGYQ